MKIQKYLSIQVFKYLSIQVFKYLSIQLQFDNWLLTNNVKARDPVGSKNVPYSQKSAKLLVIRS